MSKVLTYEDIEKAVEMIRREEPNVLITGIFFPDPDVAIKRLIRLWYGEDFLKKAMATITDMAV